MISFEDVALRRGPRLLFGQASFCVHPGQKVGLTGANGCGKSSLLALLLGRLAPDAGTVGVPAGTTVAHVAQHTPRGAGPAVEHVMDGDGELREVMGGLAAAEEAGEGERIAALHARLEAIGGYSARARAGRLMHGLGFDAAQEDRPIDELSGGWRMRLNLARALMCRSDLLLLDEPTNHLDLDAVLWLEEWLRAYRGTLLVIAHDREFLDRVTDHTLNIEARQVRLYRGSYSVFEAKRAEQLAQQDAARRRQDRDIAHMRRFVDRFRYKASKARQAQSRLKALERMERIAQAHVDSPFRFSFAEPERMAVPLVSLEQVCAGYGRHVVLEDVDLTLSPGDRVALLGANGAGKSTLTRVLAGLAPALGGEVTTAADTRVGYFAQHQLEQLDPAASPMELLRRTDAELGEAPAEQALRDYLGGFGFSGDRVFEALGPFSGGEQARLALALVVRRRPNLLLLDEPTNHLDLDMRHALTVALQDFAGALVLIAHDRHLLRSSVDALYLVAEGRVRRFDGDLDDYAHWLRHRTAEQSEVAVPVAEHSAGARRARRRHEAEQRQRLKPLRRRVAALEQRIESLSAERAELEAALADDALYAAEASARLAATIERQRQVAGDLERAEAEWLEASDALERAASPAGEAEAPAYPDSSA